MHQLLRRGDFIQLVPIGGRSTESNFVYDDHTASQQRNGQEDPQSTAPKAHPLNEKDQLVAGRDYHPRATNLLTIGPLFLIHLTSEPSPILSIFQIMWDREEYRVENSLHGVDGSGLPSNARRCYVVVVPCDTATGGSPNNIFRRSRTGEWEA